MPNAYYRKVKIRIVYRGEDRKLRWRFEYAYHVGNLYGETVRLCVYKDERSIKPHWYCVDPETGLSLSEGFTRQDATDRARERLSHLTPEKYGEAVYRAKKQLVEAGVLNYSIERGYSWCVQQI